MHPGADSGTERKNGNLPVPVLSPKDVKEKNFAMADLLWSKVFQVLPGRTTRTAAIFAQANPEKGKELLRRILRTKSPLGLATHARNVLAFREWHLLRWPNLPWLMENDSLGTRDLYTAILVDFLEDLMDSDVAPGAPRSRLGSLNAAVALCKPDCPWPT